MSNEKMTMADNVRTCLGGFLGATLSQDDDTSKLLSLGLDAVNHEAAVDALWLWFKPDRIEDLQDWPLPSMTLEELIVWCERKLDVNEFRVVDILKDSYGLAVPPSTDLRLYGLGVTDTNKNNLIQRLRNRFALFKAVRLDIRPNDINAKTTVMDLIRHIESHLVRQ